MVAHLTFGEQQVPLQRLLVAVNSHDGSQIR